MPAFFGTLGFLGCQLCASPLLGLDCLLCNASLLLRGLLCRASGLLLGDGHVLEAVGAFLLFLVNVLSIKLSGTVTFVLQGVNPGTWLEKEEARRTTQMAVTVWFCLLILVVVLIVLYQRVGAI